MFQHDSEDDDSDDDFYIDESLETCISDNRTNAGLVNYYGLASSV